MQVPRLGLSKVSFWWSSPRVCPTSWHMTRFFHAGVLYLAVLKYVSFTLTVPCVMWPPLTHICATPSHPFLPYVLLQTSTRPFVGTQFLGVFFPLRALVLPGTTSVSNTVDTLQSLDVVPR